MVSLYHDGLSTEAIGVLADRDQSVVFRQLKKVGVEMRPAHGPAIYSVNHTFFDEIDTPEKAYVLGFFITDGCVVDHAGKQRLQFHLKLSDAAHLELIAAAMCLTAPVRLRPKYAELVWYSRPQVEALARLGVMPRKSFTVGYPALRPDLHRDFIRGLFDGDGCIRPERFWLCGSSLHLLSTARQIVLDSVPLERTLPPIGSQERLHQPIYRWSGCKIQAPVLRWLYKDAYIALERKLSVVKEHWS